MSELAEEVSSAAAALRASSTFPDDDIARIERAVGRRGISPAKGDELRRAVGQIEVHVGIDLDVPTASNIPGVSAIKAVIKKLITWYLRFIGYQLTGLGHAVAGFGTAATDRVDEVDDELADLRRRVEAIEKQLGTSS